MSIRFEKNVFQLETAHTSYQMKVDPFGVLWHVWYGGKTDCDMSYLIKCSTVSFSGTICDAGDMQSYSLDTLPQEYPTAGTGDYRVRAACAVHSDGTNALDLRYEKHEILKGKYHIPGLPAVYAGADEAETLKITLKDTASDIRVELLYGVLPESDVITRSAVFVNDGDRAVTLNRAHSFCLDMRYGEWEWIHFQGGHAAERQMERQGLFHGIQECGSCRGTSSHQQNPAVILCEKDCTEEKGFCLGAALMYSGGFQAQVERDQVDQVRLVMGIQPETFSWSLKPGERFYTPEAILSCSEEGLGTLSRRFHSVIRNHVCRGKYQLVNRPVLINNWEATYFNFNTEKILNIAREAAKLGVDMLVLDDGWFGKRDDDRSGLGDWFVNENKLEGGLGRLVEQIGDMGMKFGLWFEPEMISEDSDLYRRSPEWALKIPGRGPVRSRNQLVLDMSRPDVREYLYQVMSNILKSANIEYVKWDMNRSISDWYSELLPAEQMGELPHRYVLGVYELLERLTGDFPHVLFEGCSGGGGRFDAGMLYYCPQIWCSDDTDAHERTRIQYGTSFFYPISAVGSHISAVPNHQVGRLTSLETRGVVAMAGSFGYELDLNLLSDEEKRAVREQIAYFKKHNALIHNGAYYRLSDPMSGNMAAWAFVSPDKKQALVQGVVYRSRPNRIRQTLKLAGLDREKSYRIIGPGYEETQAEAGTVGAAAAEAGAAREEAGSVYTGAALLAGGLLLPRIKGDDVSFAFELAEV